MRSQSAQALDLSSGSYSKCMASPEARAAIADFSANESADSTYEIFTRYPKDLLSLGLGDGVRKRAIRLDGLSSLPFRSLDFDTFHLDEKSRSALVGKVYVIRAGIYVGSRIEGEAAMAWLIKNESDSRGNELVQSEMLSTQQNEFLRIVCDIDGTICVGDVYLRVMPSTLGLDMELVGVDLSPVTHDKILNSYLNFYQGWLKELDSGS